MHFSPALVHLSCRIKKSWSPEPLPSSSIFILTGIGEDQPQTTPPRKHMTMNPLEFKGHVVTTVFFSFFFKSKHLQSWRLNIMIKVISILQSQKRSGFCEWNCRHLRQFVNSHCGVGIYKLLLLNCKSPLRKVSLLSFCFVLVRFFFLMLQDLQIIGVQKVLPRRITQQNFRKCSHVSYWMMRKNSFGPDNLQQFLRECRGDYTQP